MTEHEGQAAIWPPADDLKANLEDWFGTPDDNLSLLGGEVLLIGAVAMIVVVALAICGLVTL